MSELAIEIAPPDFQAWEELHALLTAAFAPMEGRIDPPSSLAAMSPDSLRRKAEAEVLLVARAGELLVACGYLQDREDALYLGKLAVGEAYRGRGILKKLIALAGEQGRLAGKSRLTLQTRIELTENHRIFEALGFAITGQTSHPGYDRPTSVTMEKAL